MRTKKACSGPGALAAAQAASTSMRAGMAAADLADPAVLGEPEPGLPDTRVEPEVAHQLLRAGEAADVADRRDEPGRDRDVDAGDREQPLDRRVIDRRASRDLAVEHVEILAEPVQLAQVPLDRGPLVVGQRPAWPARPAPAR